MRTRDEAARLRMLAATACFTAAWFVLSNTRVAPDRWALRLRLQQRATTCNATLLPSQHLRGLFGHATPGRPSSYPLFTGDTLRSFADHIFDDTTQGDDWRALARKVRIGDVVFLKTDYMDEFFAIVYPQIDADFVLATHNSDFPAPSSHATYLNDSKLLAWYAINPDAVHAKLVPIPLSLANGYWPHGKLAVVQNALHAQRMQWQKRKHALYVNMDRTTNQAARQSAVDHVASVPGTFVRRERLNYSDYLRDIADSKFVLSPPGNGVDCHRTWEAVLLNAVPVVNSSSINELFAGLPVMIVNDWTEVHAATLAAFPEPRSACVPDVLRADYWLARMRAHAPNRTQTLKSLRVLPPVTARSVEADRQAGLDTELGTLLFQLAARPDVNSVLESGFWNDGGSSMCVARGLNTHRRVDTKFVTVDADARRRAIKSRTLSQYPFVSCKLRKAAVDEYCKRGVTFDMVVLDNKNEFSRVMSTCRPRVIVLHGAALSNVSHNGLQWLNGQGYKVVRRNGEGAGNYLAAENVYD